MIMSAIIYIWTKQKWFCYLWGVSHVKPLIWSKPRTEKDPRTGVRPTRVPSYQYNLRTHWKHKIIENEIILYSLTIPSIYNTTSLNWNYLSYHGFCSRRPYSGTRSRTTSSSGSLLIPNLILFHFLAYLPDW